MAPESRLSWPTVETRLADHTSKKSFYVRSITRPDRPGVLLRGGVKVAGLGIKSFAVSVASPPSLPRKHFHDLWSRS